MIPIRDLNPTYTKPVVTYAIIAVNTAVWLFEFATQMGAGGDYELGLLVQRWGVVPFELLNPKYPETLLTPITSMFMHGGWMHFIGNMWFLHVFGDNVEDALGKFRYIVFYLLCGVGAAVAQVVIDPASSVPMVGASGAIAGVLAGYVILYPRARVVTLVPIFIFVQFMELPAYFFIFIWFGFQLLSGYMSLGLVGENVGGTAFFAHIGGFVVGLALIYLFRSSRRGPPRRRVRHEPRADRQSAWPRERGPYHHRPPGDRRFH